MKYSNQKERIYNAVLQSNLHPTADQVYAKLKKETPNISLATVYRNLGKLCDEKRLRRVFDPGRPDHYDATMREHYHGICEKCGRVCDVDLDLGGIVASIREQSRCRVTNVDLNFRAVCDACLKKEEKAKEEAAPAQRPEEK